MKRWIDLVAVLITGFMLAAGLVLFIEMLMTIPSHVWATLGRRTAYVVGAVVGFWAFFRTTDVMEIGYKRYREGQRLTRKVTHSNTTGDRS